MRWSRSIAFFFVALRLVASDARFTNDLWAGIEPVYAKTLEHPFLHGLADGTLPRAKFDYYLQQDALYLDTFSEALKALAAKAPRKEWQATLRQHAADAIEEKNQLHLTLLRGKLASEMAPTNYAYTNHLLATVARRPFAEGLAAVLPCYWIYWEVGRELKKRGSKNADYQRWIDQYSDESYHGSVEQALEMMNSVSGGLDSAARERAKQLFARSARYEYMFWDMAWKEERWPPPQ
jgi:thiaminase (transcriptional activator TenA)